jgi:DtxR family Mn-dependent transcriptional regulator
LIISLHAPSSTVENYLKAIHQGQIGVVWRGALWRWGRSPLHWVAPGTATTMVKALAESGSRGLRAYSGVRLTAAGEKLAAWSCAEDRLVELFLVQVMGMSWAEVR